MCPSLKRLNDLSERDFLKLFFLFFSCSFLIAAFFMPDRAQMLPGLWKILSQPTKASTSFFSISLIFAKESEKFSVVISTRTSSVSEWLTRSTTI